LGFGDGGGESNPLQCREPRALLENYMQSTEIDNLIGCAIERFQNGDPAQAEVFLLSALKLDQSSLLALEIMAFIKASCNDHVGAEIYLQKILSLNPQNSNALRLFGVGLASQKNWEGALEYLNKSIEADSTNVTAYSNLGNVLLELKRYEEALIAYDKATTIDPNYAEGLSNKGNALFRLKRYQEGLVFYDKAIALNPEYVEAISNKANSLTQLKRYDEALKLYDLALRLNPNYVEAHNNKSSCLRQLEQYDQALVCAQHAISIKPDYAEAWANLAEVFLRKNFYEETIQCFTQARELNISIAFLDGIILCFQEMIGDWSSYDANITQLPIKIHESKEVLLPLNALSIFDNPDLQLKSTIIWTDITHPSQDLLGPIQKYSNPKIKIAYFSADFKDHPVSYLTAELFELHDRSQFEVYGFSLKKAQHSPIRERLIAGFDHFIEVDNKTDIEIATLARNLQIDIAIDLGGHTQDARTGIFAHRAAPLQVNFLGFAGTMGASYMDYIIADEIVIPQEHKDFYLEQKVYLPNSYMVDDSNRLPSSKQFSRSEFGLPEDGVIFCCFNNSYKFNPPRIASFAKILSDTPNSVLWVSENNASFKKNLLAEFTKLGVAEHRIVFAGRVNALEDHLARYRLADLFLDTSPYNAHTTALDSLKAGTPILTLAGKSFASRVGASLLTAIGLPELIVHSENEFIELAIKLGQNPELLKTLKEKLIANYQTMPLFNSRLFCKHLEASYQEMHRLHIHDLPLSDIHISQ
jgi:predicted O-linked N-acetylglucosamine transferase (SPINDLY family)